MGEGQIELQQLLQEMRFWKVKRVYMVQEVREVQGAAASQRGRGSVGTPSSQRGRGSSSGRGSADGSQGNGGATGGSQSVSGAAAGSQSWWWGSCFCWGRDGKISF